MRKRTEASRFLGRLEGTRFGFVFMAGIAGIACGGVDNPTGVLVTCECLFAVVPYIGGTCQSEGETIGESCQRACNSNFPFGAFFGDAVLEISDSCTPNNSKGQYFLQVPPDSTEAELNAETSIFITVGDEEPVEATSTGSIAIVGADCSGSCPVTLTALELHPSDQTLMGKALTDGFVTTVSAVVGTKDANGDLTFPKETFGLYVIGNLDTVHTAAEFEALSDVTGHVDMATGVITLAGSFSGNGIQYTISLNADVTDTAPFAEAEVVGSTVCDPATGTASILIDAGDSSDPLSRTLGYTWFDGELTATSTPSVLGTTEELVLALPPGSRDVTLMVRAGNKLDTQLVQVAVQDTAPAIVDLDDQNVIVRCDPDSGTVDIPAPTVTDLCSSGSVTLEGSVIVASGVSLGTPIPVVNGKVELPPGEATVRWTATKPDGVATVVDQDFVVVTKAALVAGGSLRVRDRAHVETTEGNGAEINNLGSGVTQLGVSALTGSIWSNGAVTLANGAVVEGSVTSASSVTSRGTITGTIQQYAELSVPPALQISPSFTGSTAVTVPNDHAGYSLFPGQYGNVMVRARGKLILAAGTYYFTSLTIEPTAWVSANTSSGRTSIFVRDSLSIYDRVTTTTGDSEDLFLGYIGSSGVTIESNFTGVYVGPNASLTLGAGSGRTYRGEFTAGSIELRPDALVVHEALDCN